MNTIHLRAISQMSLAVLFFSQIYSYWVVGSGAKTGGVERERNECSHYYKLSENPF